MALPHGFKPTAFQAGHAIGAATSGELVQRLAKAADPKSLLDADISLARYADELQLLSCAAALNAIETAGLSPHTENEVAAGLFEWFREQPSPTRNFLLHHADEATEAYGEAWRSDQVSTQETADMSLIEEALGERLLRLGEANEARGQACVRLCLVVPRVLWRAQYKTAKAMLVEAGLLKGLR